MSAKVVRNYFQILEDTYLGFRIQPWTKSQSRRMIETEKFYLFDIGVANYLARRSPRMKTPEFGKSFEHYILMELMAYRAYRNPELEIRFWRTSTNQEVDFILGDKEVALEIKASDRVHNSSIKGLLALEDDGPVRKKYVLCLENEPRMITKDIIAIPWKIFLDKLWEGRLIT